MRPLFYLVISLLLFVCIQAYRPYRRPFRPRRRPILAFGVGYAAGAHHASHHHNNAYYYQSAPSYGCSSCYYGRRRRRQVAPLEDIQMTPIRRFLLHPETQAAYQDLPIDDKFECGMRVVCELAKKPTQILTPNEIQILHPYSGDPPAFKPDGTPLDPYEGASWMGKSGVDCSQTFKRCKFTVDEVLGDYEKFVLKYPVLEED